MSDSEKIDFIGGQVKALTHFIVVLINTHPDPVSLQKLYTVVKQVGLAKIEADLVDDEYLEGMQDVYQQIERVFEKRAARP